MRNAIILLSCFCLTFVHGQISTDKRLKGIEKTLNQVLADHDAAGFAVAVVKGNTVIYSQGFGFRDVANKQPVTPNTLFAIGSSSKAFTAGLMGLLQEQGKLKLDDKATTLLPELRFFSDEMNNSITVRDMMCHRTGLPRYDFSWYYFPTQSRDSLLQRLSFHKPTAGLRQAFQYNNYMFLAQGMIAEKITGTSWENAVSSFFFKPMAMNRSNTSIAALEKDSDHSLPYGVSESGEIELLDYYPINAMGPAGSINSSVSEMSGWLKVWINGGKLDGKEILPASYIQEAISSQMVMSASLPAKEHSDSYFSNYGLGWMLSSYRGHYRVEHGGNIDGFSASVCFFPADSIGIVVLSNQDGSIVPKIVRNILADRLLSLAPQDWNGEAVKMMNDSKKMEASLKESVKEEKVAGTAPSHALSSYEGTYSNPGYGIISLKTSGDKLTATAGNHRYELEHYHYDVFRLIAADARNKGKDSGLKMNFSSGVNGKIESLSIQLDETGATTFNYTSLPVKMETNELEKYAGEYDLMGTPVKVSVRGSVLYVFVPGQTDYETVAVGNHTFNLTVADGYSVKFEVADDEKIVSMSFIQPNGTFTAKRK